MKTTQDNDVIVRFVLVRANQMHGKVNNFEFKKFIYLFFFFESYAHQCWIYLNI